MVWRDGWFGGMEGWRDRGMEGWRDRAIDRDFGVGSWLVVG